jgi:hypothetical protein
MRLERWERRADAHLLLCINRLALWVVYFCRRMFAALVNRARDETFLVGQQLLNVDDKKIDESKERDEKSEEKTADDEKGEEKQPRSEVDEKQAVGRENQGPHGGEVEDPWHTDFLFGGGIDDLVLPHEIF